MQLLELTPAEVAFLTSPPAAHDDSLLRCATRKLALTLTARLRLPIQAMAHAAEASTDVPATPIWRPDAALATLWLTRRLGGQRVVGAASFVPHTLIRSLDAVLAESWLDTAAQNTLPATMAWHITANFTQAMLAVQLPHTATEMTRWARGVIRHG
ncbi:MAG: hypothetical protein ACSLEZ_04770 [Thiobacillus sp.]